jgi:hypothetical protein
MPRGFFLMCMAFVWEFILLNTCKKINFEKK